MSIIMQRVPRAELRGEQVGQYDAFMRFYAPVLVYRATSEVVHMIFDGSAGHGRPDPLLAIVHERRGVIGRSPVSYRSMAWREFERMKAEGV